MSFCKVQLYGNLGRDPELRYTPQGTPVCSFSMATSERFMKQGERQEKTLWWKVTLWGKQAETASQYLTKGRSIFIEGKPDLEEWTDRDGKPRTTLAVRATDMQFINDGQGQGQSQGDNRGGGGGSRSQGGGASGPKAALHQARQQQTAGGGLSLDDEEPPF